MSLSVSFSRPFHASAGQKEERRRLKPFAGSGWRELRGDVEDVGGAFRIHSTVCLKWVLYELMTIYIYLYSN